MFGSYRTKVLLGVVRSQACTAALASALGSTWRVPREAFRYGALAYLLAHTLAMLVVALPVVLLHLAVGQLCQQDALGMWRAIPFFKGVGFLRLLISFLGSVINFIYMALILIYFTHTVSNINTLWECTEDSMTDLEHFGNTSTECVNSTFLGHFAEEPEYFVSMALILAVMWITVPILLYSPVRVMKRIFYVLAPLVLILAVVVVPNTGSREGIGTFYKRSDLRNFLKIDIWFSALTQALWSSQTAGGYLVSASDTIYFNHNVQWTSLAVIGTCVVYSWLGCLFWFGIGGGGAKDMSAIAVLKQTYSLSVEKQVDSIWPLFIYVMLFFSGVISALTLLYPLYERYRLVGGERWRALSVVGSLVGGACALAVLAGRMPALELIEDVAIPMLIAVATLIEITAFIFVYGWKTLVEDVEFLSGRKLGKFWVLGWCAVPGVVAPFTVWWVATVYVAADWLQPWEAHTLSISAAAALLVLVALTALAVAKQVQYDFISKLKASFKPSRHWGPRDPITHYYWLARREDADRRNVPRSMYRRPRLGQFVGRLSHPTAAPRGAPAAVAASPDPQKRSNSDDWLYTVYRKNCIEQNRKTELTENKKQRSKSFDWALAPRTKIETGRFFTVPEADGNMDPSIATKSRY